jgi:hypothetical protein
MMVIALSCSMVRTQIQLTRAQIEALKSRAAQEGRSLAGLIRAAVDEILNQPGKPDPAERRRRALAAIGRYRSAPRDLSRRHDRYLAEAYR